MVFSPRKGDPRRTKSAREKNINWKYNQGHDKQNQYSLTMENNYPVIDLPLQQKMKKKPSVVKLIGQVSGNFFARPFGWLTGRLVCWVIELETDCDA